MTWLRIYVGVLLTFLGLAVAFALLIAAGPEVMVLAPEPPGSFTVPITTTTDLAETAAGVLIQSDLAA